MNAEDLVQYTRLDNFKSKQYISDLDLKKSRYRWCGPDSYVANDHADQNLKLYFNDPDRLPKYDQKLGGWHLSSKFADDLKTRDSDSTKKNENKKEQDAAPTDADEDEMKESSNPFMAEFI